MLRGNGVATASQSTMRIKYSMQLLRLCSINTASLFSYLTMPGCIMSCSTFCCDLVCTWFKRWPYYYYRYTLLGACSTVCDSDSGGMCPMCIGVVCIISWNNASYAWVSFVMLTWSFLCSDATSSHQTGMCCVVYVPVGIYPLNPFLRTPL